MQDAVLSSPRWELYRVLSEPLRLRLLALSAEEELSVGELAEILGESQPNVSRHAAALKQAGLVQVRKQGTRVLFQIYGAASSDPVVVDAVASGRTLCASDGSLARVAEVVQKRDAAVREFFARPADGEVPDLASEIGSYVQMLAPFLPRAHLAVDAGTGDGGLLEVLSPLYERVVAVDRSDAQLARAKERVQKHRLENVRFALGELGGPEVLGAVEKEGGADAVFAARLLHHAPKPLVVVRELAALCRDGGKVVVLDYARHDDESMRDRADLWLGFEDDELLRFARDAGLTGGTVSAVPSRLLGRGPDGHLAWRILSGTKSSGTATG